MNEKESNSDLVTQQELAEVHDLQEACREHHKKRRCLKEKLLSGAPVEPGAYRVSIYTHIERRITQHSLAGLLGYAAAQSIIHAVPRTARHSMTITENKKRCSAGTDAEAQPVFDPKSQPEDNELEQVPRVSFADVVAEWAANDCTSEDLAIWRMAKKDKPPLPKEEKKKKVVKPDRRKRKGQRTP